MWKREDLSIISGAKTFLAIQPTSRINTLVRLGEIESRLAIHEPASRKWAGGHGQDGVFFLVLRCSLMMHARSTQRG